MPAPKQPHLPIHPLVATLVPGGQPAESAIKLAGYAGPPSEAGKIRLYSSLDDLSHYVEFDENALVHAAEAPESRLPSKGHDVWIKANAPVRWVHEYTTASDFHDDIARNLHRLDGWRQ